MPTIEKRHGIGGEDEPRTEVPKPSSGGGAPDSKRKAALSAPVLTGPFIRCTSLSG
jgi:hypothetical protein